MNSLHFVKIIHNSDRYSEDTNLENQKNVRKHGIRFKFGNDAKTKLQKLRRV